MRPSASFVLVLAASCLLLARASAASYSAKAPMICGDAAAPTLVALDGDGNRYVAGSFFLSADFNPSKSSQIRTAHGDGPEPFVTKFDKDGVWKWTQTFGGTGTDSVAAIVATTSRVYVAGAFDSDDAGFGGTGTISAHSDAVNYGAGFVICLDAATGAARKDFNGIGAQTFGGTGGGRAAAGALALGTGVLYVGGQFTSFGFGIGGSGALNTTSQYDGFVAAIDPATGAALASFGTGGVQRFGGDGNELVRGLAVSGGRLYVGGAFGSTNFGIGGTGSLSTGQVFNSDAFVAALDPFTGAPVTAFGGDGVVVFGSSTGDEEGTALAAAGGVVYLAGDFTGPDAKIDGAGPPAPVVGLSDVFVMALDADGSRHAAFAGGLQVFGSPEDDGPPTGLVATTSGVYVCGALGAAGAGIGGRGAVESADGYVVALDPATGAALAGFGDDGVRTVLGAPVAGEHVAARISGIAASLNGLALVGSTPPRGAYDGTAFPAGGGFLLSIDPADGLPLNMGLNRRPTFESPLVPSANPVVRGRSVSFRIAASDPDGDKLVYQWDWGDGTFSAGKSPKKSWKLPGTYHVRATVADDRGGQTQSAPLDVEVVPTDIPFFDVSKLTIALRFSKTGADEIVVTGQAPASDGVPLFTKIFSIRVGAVSRDFVINYDDRSNPGDETVAMKPAVKGVAQFVVRLKGGYAALLAPLGLTDATQKNAYAAVPVHVEFFGGTYDETVPVFWSATAGTGGSAK